MTSTEIQQQLFSLIKEKLPPHQSLSDVVQQMLDIGSDSAYRRIRGEKPLVTEELQKLCTSFNISLDKLFNITSETTLFQTSYLSRTEPDFAGYLKNILQHMEALGQQTDAKVYVDAKDIPPFHYYGSEMLSALKFYVWMRFTGQIDAAEPLTFKPDQNNKELFSLGKAVLQCYSAIQSTEIWNPETINSTLRQIDFYCESGIIKDGGIARELLIQLKELVMRIEKQVEAGRKFQSAANSDSSIEFNFFVNGVFLGDNCILTASKKSAKVFVTHGILDYMTTEDEKFVTATRKSFDNIMRKSSLISVTNERERVKFFNDLQEKIDHRIQRIKN